MVEATQIGIGWRGIPQYCAVANLLLVRSWIQVLSLHLLSARRTVMVQVPSPEDIVL
jgi:hypothetical protein